MFSDKTDALIESIYDDLKKEAIESYIDSDDFWKEYDKHFQVDIRKIKTYLRIVNGDIVVEIYHPDIDDGCHSELLKSILLSGTYNDDYEFHACMNDVLENIAIVYKEEMEKYRETNQE